ncbi:hypothetical protein EON66_08605, partial [archaeon]
MSALDAMAHFQAHRRACLQSGTTLLHSQLVANEDTPANNVAPTTPSHVAGVRSGVNLSIGSVLELAQPADHR